MRFFGFFLSYSAPPWTLIFQVKEISFFVLAKIFEKVCASALLVTALSWR
jgi:hypothetical protein